LARHPGGAGVCKARIDAFIGEIARCFPGAASAPIITRQPTGETDMMDYDNRN